MNNANPPSQSLPDLSNTPLDVSTWPCNRLTAERVPDEAPFTTLPDTPAFAQLRQYEWVGPNSFKHRLLLGWVPASRGLMLIDDSGDRVIVYDFASIVTCQCDHLPACWLIPPDNRLMRQEPVPPQPFDTKEFIEAVENWQSTVKDCLELFDDKDDYVDYLIFGREDLELLSAQHPAYKLLPEWNLVLQLDVQFCACAAQAWQIERDGPPPAWTQRYTAWWQRAGWAIYSAIERDFARSPRGIALTKKRADEEAAYHAIVKPPTAQWEQVDICVQENSEHLNTLEKLPFGIWVMHPTFGAGMVIAHESSPEFGEAVTIFFALEGRKTIVLQGVRVKLCKWHPRSRDNELTVLRGLGVAEGNIQSKSFDACCSDLVLAMRGALKVWPLNS